MTGRLRGGGECGDCGGGGGECGDWGGCGIIISSYFPTHFPLLTLILTFPHAYLYFLSHFSSFSLTLPFSCPHISPHASFTSPWISLYIKTLHFTYFSCFSHCLASPPPPFTLLPHSLITLSLMLLILPQLSPCIPSHFPAPFLEPLLAPSAPFPPRQTDTEG